jgi:hypothetical protein
MAKAAKRKKVVVDDEDHAEDLEVTAKRPGRPRSPEQFGPPKPEPHEHVGYWHRLQSILDAIEIPKLDMDARLYLQRTLRMHDVLRTHDPKRFTAELIMLWLALRSRRRVSAGISASCRGCERR